MALTLLANPTGVRAGGQATTDARELSHVFPSRRGDENPGQCLVILTPVLQAGMPAQILLQLNAALVAWESRQF
jgi:hypothetical protein